MDTINPPANYPPDVAHWPHPPPGAANFHSNAPPPNYNHPYPHYNQPHPNFNNGPAFTAHPVAYWPDARKRKFHHPIRGPPASLESFAKLYVSQVPRTSTEEDIRSVFCQHGKILEVVLIRDKRSGQQQGNCFVKFATVGEAERAIRALHNQYTYPGETEPLKVKLADGEHERLGMHGLKLYVKNLNRQATKREIEELFSEYGNVEDVHLFCDELKHSRGTAFIKFPHRYMAEAAINALNGTYFMRDCEHPLVVRFADAKPPPNGDPRSYSTIHSPTFSPPMHGTPRRYKLPPTHDTTGGQILPYNVHQGLAFNYGTPVQTLPTNPLQQAIEPVAHKQPQLTAPSVSHRVFHPQQQSSPLMPPPACYPTNTAQESSQPFTDMVALVETPAEILEMHSKEHVLSQQLIEDQATLHHKDEDQLTLHQMNEDQLMSRPQALISVQQQSDQSSLPQLNTDQGLPEQTSSAKIKPHTVGNSAVVETVEPTAHCGSPMTTSSLEVISSLDCDWSEHFCPDGHKYYYNSETCESRWEKPVDYASFEKHVLKLIQKETSYSTSQGVLSSS
ncbi:unnamed protein product [Rhodiola kirilowii]